MSDPEIKSRMIYVAQRVDIRGNTEDICHTFDLKTVWETILYDKGFASKWELERNGYIVNGWEIIPEHEDAREAYIAWCELMFEECGYLPPPNYHDEL